MHLSLSWRSSGNTYEHRRRTAGLDEFPGLPMVRGLDIQIYRPEGCPKLILQEVFCIGFFFVVALSTVRMEHATHQTMNLVFVRKASRKLLP
jgi:hypothetical protein